MKCQSYNCKSSSESLNSLSDFHHSLHVRLITEDGKWNVDSPHIVEIGSDMPISCIIAIEDEIWVACGDTIYIIPVDENEFQVKAENNNGCNYSAF